MTDLNLGLILERLLPGESSNLLQFYYRNWRSQDVSHAKPRTSRTTDVLIKDLWLLMDFNLLSTILIIAWLTVLYITRTRARHQNSTNNMVNLTNILLAVHDIGSLINEFKAENEIGLVGPAVNQFSRLIRPVTLHTFCSREEPVLLSGVVDNDWNYVKSSAIHYPRTRRFYQRTDQYNKFKKCITAISTSLVIYLITVQKMSLWLAH